MFCFICSSIDVEYGIYIWGLFEALCLLLHRRRQEQYLDRTSRFSLL